MKIEMMPLGAYQTNCYILWQENRDDCVIIDPGFEAQRVLLKARQLKKNIAAILLTHGHFDHVGAVREIAEMTNCAVYLCEKDMLMPARMTAGPLYHTHGYAEADVLDLAGMTFQVLHTPGHTEGSVCLLTEGNLFSGDTLFAGTCGRTDLPGGDWETIRRSLVRLSKLDQNYTVYPGHGETTTLDKERMYNPYMR